MLAIGDGCMAPAEVGDRQREVAVLAVFTAVMMTLVVRRVRKRLD